MARPMAGPGSAILARWSGTCEACGEPIRRGDLIVEDGTWIHEDCFEEREAAAREIAERERGR